jgi:hypothetical protein
MPSALTLANKAAPNTRLKVFTFGPPLVGDGGCSVHLTKILYTAVEISNGVENVNSNYASTGGNVKLSDICAFVVRKCHGFQAT